MPVLWKRERPSCLVGWGGFSDGPELYEKGKEWYDKIDIKL